MTKYINADKQIDKMDKILDDLRKSIKYEGLDEFISGYAEATFCVDNAPAADVVEVVHARWKWFEDIIPSTPDHPMEVLDCGWRCGECKRALEDMVGGYWDNPDEAPEIKYCPCCGAKMDEEEQ